MASSSVGRPLLSTSWEVTKQHELSFNGGKVVLSSNEKFLVCWCSGDITLLHIATGCVLYRVECDEDDSFSSFALHANDTTLAVSASKSRIVQVYDISAITADVDSYIAHKKVIRDGDEESNSELTFVHQGFKPHNNYSVQDMTFDATGRMLATYCMDKNIRVYDTTTYAMTHVFNCSDSAANINRIYFHPQPSKLQLISSDDRGVIRVWSLIDRTHTKLESAFASVTSISFFSAAADAAAAVAVDQMYAVGHNKVINVWDLNTMKLVNTITAYEELEAAVTIAVTPAAAATTTAQQPHVLTAGSKGLLKLWDVSTRKCVHTYNVLHNSEQSLYQATAATATATAAAAKSKDNRDHTAVVSSITHLFFGKKTQTVIAITAEHNIYVYSATATTAKQQQQQLQRQHQTSANSNAAAATTAAVATPLLFKRVKLLIGYNDEILDIKHHPVNNNNNNSSNNSNNNNTHNLIYVVTNSTQIRVFDTTDFNCIALLTGHSDTVLAIDISTDGNWLVSVSADATARIWSTHTHRCVAVCVGHTETVSCVKFCHQRVAAAAAATATTTAAAAAAAAVNNEFWFVTGSRDKTLKKWDCSSLLLHEHYIRNPDCNGDDSDIDSAMIINTTAAAAAAIVVPCVHSVAAHSKDINCIAISPNNTLIASGSQDKTIRIYHNNVSNNNSNNSSSSSKSSGGRTIGSNNNNSHITHVSTLSGHSRGVWCVAFSSVDRVLVSGSGDKTVKIWNLKNINVNINASSNSNNKSDSNNNSNLQLSNSNMSFDCECIQTFEGHSNNVLAVAFINHSTQLMTAAADGCVRVFTVADGVCVATFDEHEGKVWALCVVNNDNSNNRNVKARSSQQQQQLDDSDDEEQQAKQQQQQQLQQLRQLITGGTDSIIRVWTDVTQQQHEQATTDSNVKQKKQQVLSNLMKQKQYGAAMLLAVDLQQPRVLYSVLYVLCCGVAIVDDTMTTELQVATTAINNSSNKATLADVVSRMDVTQINVLLQCCIDWNTNSKHMYVAQQTMRTVFALFSPSSLLQCQALRQHLHTLLLYSEKHITRTELLLQKSYFVDYACNAMKLLKPAADSNGVQTEASIISSKIDNSNNKSNNNSQQQQKRKQAPAIVSEAAAFHITSLSDRVLNNEKQQLQQQQQQQQAISSNNGSKILSAASALLDAQQQQSTDSGDDSDSDSEDSAFASNWDNSTAGAALEDGSSSGSDSDSDAIVEEVVAAVSKKQLAKKQKVEAAVTPVLAAQAQASKAKKATPAAAAVKLSAPSKRVQ